MSSMEEYQHIPTSGSGISTPTTPIPEMDGQQGGVEQLAFPGPMAVVPNESQPLMGPNVTGRLDFTPHPPTTTQSLPEALSTVRTTTATLRQPVVIRGKGKRTHAVRPPQGRRHVINVAVTVLLGLTVLAALVLVLPTGTEGESAFGHMFSPITNTINSKGTTAGLIAQQAATATAVTQDGYDPGNQQTYAGVPTAPPGYAGVGGVGNHFFYGQCTYWASMRYYALTGMWVPWLGNAWQWEAGAQQSGWVVSATPHLHSIIVLQPGIEGAGWYGHVAIVEQINPDGSVLTSNFNWAGAWGIRTMVLFKPGAGVSFVYAPGF